MEALIAIALFVALFIGVALWAKHRQGAKQTEDAQQLQILGFHGAPHLLGHIPDLGWETSGGESKDPWSTKRGGVELVLYRHHAPLRQAVARQMDPWERGIGGAGMQVLAAHIPLCEMPEFGLIVRLGPPRGLVGYWARPEIEVTKDADFNRALKVVGSDPAAVQKLFTAEIVDLYARAARKTREELARMPGGSLMASLLPVANVWVGRRQDDWLQLFPIALSTKPYTVERLVLEGEAAVEMFRTGRVPASLASATQSATLR